MKDTLLLFFYGKAVSLIGLISIHQTLLHSRYAWLPWISPRFITSQGRGYSLTDFNGYINYGFDFDTVPATFFKLFTIINLLCCKMASKNMKMLKMIYANIFLKYLVMESLFTFCVPNVKNMWHLGVGREKSMERLLSFSMHAFRNLFFY